MRLALARKLGLRVAAGVTLFPGVGCVAHAADPTAGAPAPPQFLAGDLFGVRPKLAASGIELGITYIGEAFGNLSGGVKRGAVYEGQLAVTIDADLAKLAGLPGGKAHVSAMDIHGRGPSADLLGSNLMTVSNIEAHRTVRLYEFWLEQSLLRDRLSLRVGQLAADAEFITSDTAGGLINGTFGWPALTAADIRGGGPAYPLPQPGIRLQASPADGLTLRGAVFSDNPGGPNCTGDPQVCDAHGVTFNFSGGTLWLAEIAYAANAGEHASGLPGTYKLGAWRETGAFTDQLTGAPDRRGNWGIYGIVDQTLWRPADGGNRGLSAFVRAGGAPSDRNLISWYVDGGLGVKAPFDGRPDDVLTLGIAYAHISDRAAASDRMAEPPTPVRDHEAVIELSYAASIRPGWTVQPDLQYVIHPGGNAAHPTRESSTIGDALVLGLRTTLRF